MKPRFVVSVDTEEDIWGWRSKAPITCSNVRELPRLARFFRCLHIRPTFFVSYQVLSDPSARAVIKDLAAEDGFEIGGHVHPWNTPPYDGSHRRTVLHNLPPEVQASKIATVTEAINELLGRRPSSFRAGRFGFGPTTAACLIEQGYEVDSSVTPFFDWTGSSGGQNYIGAPLHIYRMSPQSGVLRGDPNGRLIEVPLTSGYTRLAVDRWKAAGRFLSHTAVRAVRGGSFGARVLGFRKVVLSREPYAVRDMVRLGHRALEAGVGHLHLFFHSSSLVPGLTPFTSTSQDVERLYDHIEAVLDGLQRWYEFDFASVTEAAVLSSWAFPRLPVEGNQSSSAAGSGRRGAGSFPIRQHEPFRWPVSYNIKERVERILTHVYWRLGGYRRYGRVRWSSVKRLVFVCAGNICRSPYAEHVARAQNLDAVSIGVRTRPGGAADPPALQVAHQRGISMDGHRTKPLALFEPQEGDLFVAMEPSQAAAIAEQPWARSCQITLLGLWSGCHGCPVVPDPYGKDERRFNECFSMIERGIARIQRRLERAAEPQVHGSSRGAL